MEHQPDVARVERLRGAPWLERRRPLDLDEPVERVVRRGAAGVDGQHPRLVPGQAGYRASAGSPVAWLAGIARNVVGDHVRRRVREGRAHTRLSGRALLDEQSVELLAQRIDAERLTRELYRSLADLPSQQRAVVELVAVDGLSLAEAARALGITPGNARVRYHRARARLQHVLPSPFEVTA